MWKQIESRLIAETKPFHLDLKSGFPTAPWVNRTKMFFVLRHFWVQSWPTLISISVDQMIFSANKRHHPLLCLPVCISAYAPTHHRHFVLLPELPSCCRKMHWKWLQTHSRRPLWTGLRTNGETYRETMQGGHRMKCVWGYRWGMTALPPGSLCRGERRHKRSASAQRKGLLCVLKMMNKVNSAAMPFLDNRQKRHVGWILAKCQNC